MRGKGERVTLAVGVLLGILLLFFIITVVRNFPSNQKNVLVVPSVDANDPGKGPRDARVTIIEFGDFQCPYCRLAQTPFNAALARYSGNVRHVWKDYPLVGQHPEAVNAAEAGQCAHDQGKFWEMHDALFSRQDDLGEALYTELATTIGLDSVAFVRCMEDDRTLARIEESVMQADQAGIDGVPYYFVNDRRFFETLDGENLEAIIESQL